ncbi:Alpha/Beta hydrolase protein [Cunninghamella echinulata]|nr:Alpha/Beta hydrolase protein [Cunninghamella echinulata]
MKIKSLLNNLFLLATNTYVLASTLPTNKGEHIFHSKLYPNHTVTFKTPSFCDPTVKQYSGYIDVSENDHYFFWFFESRKQPKKDPLTLWLNGGPGASSMIGLWMESGPCRVNEDGSQAIYNEKGSWNKVSNMLFIDQPSKVGFSYGDSQISSTKDAAKYIHVFLQIFYEAFPQYQFNAFHLYGDSFAGHYVPSFADYILKQNKLHHKNKKYIPVHLKSIGIGNGNINPIIQSQYYEKMACNSSYGPLLPKEVCKVMRTNMPHCIRLLEKCNKTNKNQDCADAFAYCYFSVESPFTFSGRSSSDIRTNKEIPSIYINFLNKTSTMEAIGAKQAFSEASDVVSLNFMYTGDRSRSFAPEVANLLNNNVKVLIYAGDTDYICNWLGNHAWVNQLEFKNYQVFQKDKLKPWYIGNKEVGQIQQGANLTFLRIYEAGHLVPANQPEVALKMFNDQIRFVLK